MQIPVICTRLVSFPLGRPPKTSIMQSLSSCLSLWPCLGYNVLLHWTHQEPPRVPMEQRPARMANSMQERPAAGGKDLWSTPGCV